MKLMDSVFETMASICIFLAVSSLSVWMLSGGVNDWGVMHKISMSMALVGLVCSILTLLFLVVCGAFCLVQWLYQGGLK